jgi:PiT family inorganic phosphate transporter
LRELGLLSIPCVFGVVSGFNDGGNLLASFTSGRVITPRAATGLLLLAPLGPLLVGTEVARTVGLSVIDLPAQGPIGFVLITTVAVAIVLGSWRWQIPTSMTLALVGAMLGWVLAVPGAADVRWHGFAKALLGTPLSVAGGLACAFAFHRVARRALGRVPHARAVSIARAQYVSSALQAIAYGSNDMEKTIGLLAAAELAAGAARTPQFTSHAPLLIASGSFVAGSALGGWRVARRVGSGIFRVRPVQALSEQLSAGLVVAACALGGVPVSSTQAIGGSLVGVGTSVRASAVRWSVVRLMLASWLVTLPSALVCALLLHLALRIAVGVR